MMNRFRVSLTRFELTLWLTSLSVVSGTALIFSSVDEI